MASIIFTLCVGYNLKYDNKFVSFCKVRRIAVLPALSKPIISIFELFFTLLNILTLFFVPDLVRFRNYQRRPNDMKNYKSSVLKHLKDANDYYFEFNSILSKITNGEIYLEMVNTSKIPKFEEMN